MRTKLTSLHFVLLFLFAEGLEERLPSADPKIKPILGSGRLRLNPLSPVGHTGASNTTKRRQETATVAKGHERVPFRCLKAGNFPKPGSCKEFYHCKQKRSLAGQRFKVYKVSCPLGTIFEASTLRCEPLLLSLVECKADYTGDIPDRLYEVPAETLKRLSSKWLLPTNQLKVELDVSSIHAIAKSLYFTGIRIPSIYRNGKELLSMAHKLAGIQGKINNISLPVLENNITNKVHAEVIKTLIDGAVKGNKASFFISQQLNEKGIVENHISTALQQGLIIHRDTYENTKFAKIQVNLGKVEHFVKEEITEAITALRNGFRQASSAISLSQIEPIVSEILGKVEEFYRKLDQLQSLPENNWTGEIVSSDGFHAYLNASTLESTLHHILQNILILPINGSGLPSLLTLDLFIDALQLHLRMFSSMVSSTTFLALKAMEDKAIDRFNFYLKQVSMTIIKAKNSLGYGYQDGIIATLKMFIAKFEQLPFVLISPNLTRVVRERYVRVAQIESDFVDLVINNIELNTPPTIDSNPNFSSSSLEIPIGPWELGKKVMYAIQFASEWGLSPVGEWSAPYNIDYKAFPIIRLPPTENGVLRLLYRQFDDEKPELVAVVRNTSLTEIRDIGHDIVNDAFTCNFDCIIREVEELVNENDADINISIENKWTLLHYAAKTDNSELMNILISKNADISSKAFDDRRPLHLAAIYGSINCAKILIERGANVNAQTNIHGMTPLHLSVAYSHIDITKLLIGKGANVNVKDSKGLTPLHIAMSGNTGAVDALIKIKPVDVNAVTQSGLAPLHYAARCYNEIYIQSALNISDINVDVVNEHHLTPLHLAAMTGNPVTITNLHEKGVYLSPLDEDENTPLHYAAFYGNKQVALELMQLVPSMQSLKNAQGRSALDLAIQNKAKELIGILTPKGRLANRIEDLPKDASALEKNRKFLSILSEGRNTNVTCSSGIVNKMAADVDQTCIHVGNIESYVDLVMEMIPLHIYYGNQSDYSEVFKNFDNDLFIAKSHVNMWRKGDSIVKGISRTIELSRDFELEFRERYNINKERVKSIRNNVNQTKMIRELEAEIAELEERKRNTSEMLTHAKFEVIRNFLKFEISKIDNKIANKTQILKENATIIQELEELVIFLEFVRSDSMHIQNIANKTKDNLETFRDYLEHDKGAFERHSRIAKDTYNQLENKAIEANQELAENMETIKKLESQIEKERKEIGRKYEIIEENLENINKQTRLLLDTMDRNVLIGLISSIISVGVGYFFNLRWGAYILSGSYAYLASAQTDATSRFQSIVEANDRQVGLILRHIDQKTNEISRLHKQILKTSNVSESLKNDLMNFSILDGDLKNLSAKTEKIIEAVSKAMIGVNSVKGIFDEVTQKLGEMIDFAKRAKTEAERNNAMFFIYHELSLLECNWNNVYIKVGTLDECTRYYGTNYL